MTLPRTVRLLDPHTINQIAAGEVVERPASVVKELVENALDAGATRIHVDLVNAGKTLIRVRDDGCGMSLEDAQNALLRHATSKITSADDLLAVGSLGFRGEAMPSIASVSRMTIRTACEDGLAHVLRVEGGEIEPPQAAAAPRGTEITVEDLFFNTPARLKFLKSDTTELGQALEHVGRYAIAYPHVAFTLTHNGQVGIQTHGTGDRLEALAGVWGRDLARTLAAVETEVHGIRAIGFVSPPHVTKSSRAYQYLFVNGRPVRTRTLTAAIDQAYRDMTPERRYPVLALMLQVDPATVDVNVSPTKSEIKFQREGSVFDVIRHAVRGSLMEHGMIPSLDAVASANEALRAAMSPGSPTFLFPSLSSPVLEDPRPALAPEEFRLVEAPLPTSGIEVPAMPTNPLEASRMPFLSLLEGLRVVGQVMNTFIVAETKHGLVLIDQHVAHERILYEYLCGLKGSSAIERQALLVPQTLHLDRRAAVLLRERLDELEAVGFGLEPFGGESYVVREVPAAIRGKDPLRILRNLVDELVESAVTRRLVPTREQIWITSACHMAVKAGDPLSVAEMEKLIVDLATTENPYLCPHGRPITVTLSAEALLRLFKRT